MMTDLNHLRRQVDEIDEQILLALSKRVQICKAIGAAKKAQQKPIKDADRENEVYMHVRENAKKLSLDPDQVEAVYREIVNMCSVVQLEEQP
ncbi:MAG: chorismate mutase [Candidatus Bathyarchaeota archaeon]|nr:chorismate mutase [Candidatus Bathyarchaeota archaeon]